MVQVVVVNKTGECINANLTTMDKLYKKCGFKKSEGFEIERHLDVGSKKERNMP